MSFSASNNRIVISDAAGKVKFDTNNRMPAIIQTIQGSYNLAEANYLDPNNNRQYFRVLANTDPTANFIYPVYRYREAVEGFFTPSEYTTATGTMIHTLGFGYAMGPVMFFSSLTFTLNKGVIGISTEGSFKSPTIIDYKIFVGKI